MWIRINGDYNRFNEFIFQDRWITTSGRISVTTKLERFSLQDLLKGVIYAGILPGQFRGCSNMVFLKEFFHKSKIPQTKSLFVLHKTLIFVVEFLTCQCILIYGYFRLKI